MQPKSKVKKDVLDSSSLHAGSQKQPSLHAGSQKQQSDAKG